MLANNQVHEKATGSRDFIYRQIRIGLGKINMHHDPQGFRHILLELKLHVVSIRVAFPAKRYYDICLHLNPIPKWK